MVGNPRTSESTKPTRSIDTPISDAAFPFVLENQQLCYNNKNILKSKKTKQIIIPRPDRVLSSDLCQ
jgi:hypothetical protein